MTYAHYTPAKQCLRVESGRLSIRIENVAPYDTYAPALTVETRAEALDCMSDADTQDVDNLLDFLEALPTPCTPAECRAFEALVAFMDTHADDDRQQPAPGVLSAFESAMIRFYRTLPEDEKAFVLAYMKHC